MKNKKRIPTDAEPTAWTSPFAALKDVKPSSNAPAASVPHHTGNATSAPKKSRGRVDIMRQTAHRGGKTVTVVTGFAGISQDEKERLATAMQKACGAGGTVKDGRIEVQGDQREIVARVLTDAGFRPVFAGG